VQGWEGEEREGEAGKGMKRWEGGGKEGMEGKERKRGEGIPVCVFKFSVEAHGNQCV